FTAPGDFTEESGSLTVTEDGSVECVSITIVNDIEDEEDMECFAFSISTTTSGSVSLDISLATICIIDNDVTDVAIGLEQTVYSVTESDSFALVCTTVLSGSIAGRTLSIGYQTAEDSALASDDYTAVSGNFDMTDTNTVQCIPISIISDSVTETDEECFTFTISTTSTAPGLTLSPTSASVCINEVASEAVTIGLRQSYYSTVEGEGPVEICISTVSGDFEGSSFSVSYSTTSGQAEAPSDYVAVSGSVEISESQTSQCVTVSIVTDSVEEGEECFLVSFSSSSSDFTLQSPSVAAVCIRDAPSTAAVVIGLQESQYTVLFQTSDSQFACVEVLSGDVAGREIMIDFSVEDSANTQTQNGTLLFTDDATIQCVAVSVSSVSAGSTDESCLTLTLSPTTNVTGLTISPDLATVCVVPIEGK
ncbi:Adhesion G-protein coupled receptor V1, partial [Geodia barretti]